MANPLGLLTMMGLMNQNPSNDPSNPLRAPVAAPGEGADAPQGPEIPPAVALMLGQQAGASGGGGDGGMMGLLTTMFRQQEQQRIQQQQARQFAAAVAPVDGLVREQKYTEAATAYRNAAAIAPTPAHAAALEKAAQKYEEMGAQVDIAQMEKAGAEAIKRGGPQALLADPKLVAGLARRPGGVVGFLKDLAPKQEEKGGEIWTTPSPVIGGPPTRQVLSQPPTITADVQKVLDTHGLDSEAIRQAYASEDPARIGVARSQIALATQQVRGEEVAKRLGMDPQVTAALGVMGQKPYDVLVRFEGGDPQAQKLVAQAQKAVDKRAVDKAVNEYTQKLLVERTIKGSDPFQVGGKEAYDINTGQPVHVTAAMSQNPKTFAANGGPVTYMTTQEAQQMRFMLSEIDPSLAAAKTLSDRILSKAKVANIPTGVALDAKKWAGDADVAQFKEEIRKLIVAEGRIEGGSVRIPVTMMHMLEGTLPTTYSTVDQASRLLNSLQAAAINRRKGFLGREDFTSVPTQEGEFVQANVQQGKDGRWNLSFQPKTLEGLKRPGAK